MKNIKKNKTQLIDELNESQKRITELEEALKGNKLKEDECHRGIEKYSEKTFMSIIQDIINVFPYYVIIVDEDHDILLANDKILNTLGKSVDDIVGHYCPNVIHGTNDVFPGCPLEEALQKDRFIEKDLLDPFYKTWVSSAIYPMNFCELFSMMAHMIFS